MQNKNMFLIALGALAACGSLATGLLAEIVPPNLNPGTLYQLEFATAGSRDALSGNINDYNAFVQQQAAQSSPLPSGVTWHAVASTFVAANVNAPSFGLPVYDTLGTSIPNPYSPLYRTDVPNNPTIGDQFGNALTLYDQDVWTGSTGDGFPLNFGPNDMFFCGNLFVVCDSAYGAYPRFAQESHRLYALSTPIKVLSATGGGGQSVVGGSGVTFGDVTTPGAFASQYATPATPAELQQAIGVAAAGAVNFPIPGGHPQAWNITFSGAFTGGATAELRYDPSLLGAVPESLLRIAHYNGSTWDILLSQVDTSAHTIKFTTDGFSPFMLAAVPEPSSLLLCGTSLFVGFCWAAARRRRQAHTIQGASCQKQYRCLKRGEPRV